MRENRIFPTKYENYFIFSPHDFERIHNVFSVRPVIKEPGWISRYKCKGLERVPTNDLATPWSLYRDIKRPRKPRLLDNRRASNLLFVRSRGERRWISLRGKLVFHSVSNLRASLTGYEGSFTPLRKKPIKRGRVETTDQIREDAGRDRVEKSCEERDSGDKQRGFERNTRKSRRKRLPEWKTKKSPEVAEKGRKRLADERAKALLAFWDRINTTTTKSWRDSPDTRTQTKPSCLSTICTSTIASTLALWRPRVFHEQSIALMQFYISFSNFSHGWTFRDNVLLLRFPLWLRWINNKL